jgi:hypothetical protein
MKNIIKYMIVVLSTLSFSAAQAGELSVTGSAKASYSIVSSDGTSGAANVGKGLGVTNEFSLGASGENDFGTWTYKQDIDGATVQDDGQLTLKTSYGTFGVFISEGGLDTDNTASQSVLSRPSDTSYNEGMFDSFDLSGANTMQYHMPADLLPYGIVGKIAYAPSSGSAGSVNDYKAAGAANEGTFTASTAAFNTTTAPFAQTSAMGRTAVHYQLKAAPIDGLGLGADYVEYKKLVGATAQDPESGSIYATYAFGPTSVGYSKSYASFAMSQGGIPSTDLTESVENTKYSIAFNVNDDLSISYENEESNPDNQTAATENFTLEATGIQAAYTVGGMTLALAMNEYSNSQYTQNLDVKNTVFSVAMEF